MHALTRSASLTDYEHVARSVGLDPFRMLRMAKLPAKALDDPNVLISADSVGWLLEESARLSGQEAFGLLLAETRSLANLGMLALLIREEPTLRAAVQSLVRYMRLQNAGVQLRLDDAGDMVMLHVGVYAGSWRLAPGYRTVDRHRTADVESAESRYLPAGKDLFHPRAARQP